MRNKKFVFKVKDEDFRKSSWSDHPRKVCVQVAITRKGVAVRDSKNLKKTTLFYTNQEWEAFTKGIKAGEFDLK